VLIVCTANVCRSPYAEHIIEQAFRRDSTLENVHVGSSGIRSVRGGHICSLVASRMPPSPERAEFIERHRSIRATASRVAQAKLILTASRSNRAALAFIDPTARSRTFTLREAAWLGSNYVRDPSLEGTAAIAAFARYLDSQRGVNPPPPPVRTGWFARPGDPLSIPDGHNLGNREHLRTLKQVETISAAVARLITVGSDAEATQVG
jgi:protein-tyrosine phosphatase